jgi:hypothetical protein
MHMSDTGECSVHWLRRPAFWVRQKRAALAVALIGSGLILFGMPAIAVADPAALVATSASGTGHSVDHQAWDALLKTYVKPGTDGLNRVDYAAFKRAGHTELKAYLARLQAVDPKGLSRMEQFAFLANLYNAKTIDIVLDKYPVKSIKDIKLGGGVVAAFTGGPWKAKVLVVAGTELSLDDIEHGILRAVFKDPRVHYAVNCASVGCPNLQPEAFTAAKLESLLDAGANAYVNHPRGVTVSTDGVRVSSIYNWFKVDFGDNDAAVLKHLGKYAKPDLAQKLKSADRIAGDSYDWTLNDVAR